MMFSLGVRSEGTLYQKLEDIVKFSINFSGRMSDKTVGSNWRGTLAPGVIQWQ